MRLIKRKEKMKEKKFKKCSGFQKLLKGSEIHVYLKDRLTDTKEESVLTSAFTVVLKGYSFTLQLADSSRVHPVSDLGDRLRLL